MKTVGFLRSFTLTFLTIVAALWFLMRASPASAAGNCLQDEFGKKVNCTANDVSLTGATNIRGLDGKPMASCFAGTTFSFIADFQVVTTATARENIGFYLGTGQANAISGTCTDQIISPLHFPGDAGTPNIPPLGDPNNQCIQNGGTRYDAVLRQQRLPRVRYFPDGRQLRRYHQRRRDESARHLRG
jgi:hypothetical protein